MKNSFNLIVLLCLAIAAPAQQKLLSPKDFLGYELGERFTRHDRAVAYYRHVADVMPNVELYQYGETNEHRPLVYAVVTSQENFKNLEQIRLNNLRRAGMESGAPSADKKAIVWLSYNVHGNEASGMEASLLTLYELSNPANPKTQEWLKNTVVILDPCINPDGRDRYANFYNQYGNVIPNAHDDAFEHHEPWPDGRENHYLFDLNRDWAWGTQKETQQRIKVYNSWMPHIHVDFHEQGYSHPYYFAPAAEPFHEVITPWQRNFQTLIGKNNAKYFDEQGWLYFTKEVFDLYYPSYGDTYPTYSGSIGMTYEQAGGGYAGLSIVTPEEDPLTLRDRLIHHFTTGLSTVEITAQNYGSVVDEFGKYFQENISNPTAAYKTFVIKADNNGDKLKKLTSWMDFHSIQYGHAAAGRSASGYEYQTQKTTSFNLTTDDIIVNIYQPKSRFISTVFEPKSKLPDSLTYDITAWNLMYAYDLKAYAATEKIAVGKKYQPASASNKALATKPYAYVVKYQSLNDVEFIARLMKKGVKVRAAQRAFTTNGQSFDAGSIIITRRNNEKISDFDNVVQSLAKELDRELFTTMTGFVDKGKDFGSSEVNYLKAPKVGMLFGPQTSSLSAGEIWHFFEQELHYPITQIGTDYFRNSAWQQYDVLVVPSGSYRIFDESLLSDISAWASKGGRLIVIGNGLNSFADHKGFALKKFASDQEKEKAEKAQKDKSASEALLRYEDSERKEISELIFGAIYKVNIDNSHPLAFGLKDTYYSLKTNELRFAFLENGWNVGVIKGKTKPVQGFAGYTMNQRLENSLVFGVEVKGEGSIIYMVDNPLFRDFWENGKLIFANAVFMR
jgi:hypothetical protein